MRNNSRFGENEAPSKGEISEAASLSKSAATLRVAFLIIACALIVFAIAGLVSACVEITAGSVHPDSINALVLNSLFSACALLLFSGIFIVASTIFKDVSLGQSPFTARTAKKIRIISWLLFIYALLDTAIPKGLVVNQNAGGNGVSIVRFDPEYIKVNVTAFAVALVFYFLSSVFKYGVQLQELSDDVV